MPAKTNKKGGSEKSDGNFDVEAKSPLGDDEEQPSSLFDTPELGNLPKASIIPPPLPKPPKSHVEAISSSTLIDIPCCYLYDRSSWAGFKKALNECGCTWNLPE